MSGQDPGPPARGTPSAQQRLARLVPTGASTAARAPFVLLIAVLLGAGMLALLLLNASLNQGSFELSELRRQTQELTDEQQELQAEVDGYSAPDELARRAAELGLVPGGPPVFLSPDGTVLGEPVPAPEPEPEPAEEAEPEPEEAGPDPEEEPGPTDPEPEAEDDAGAADDAEGAENADDAGAADDAADGDAGEGDAAETPGPGAAEDAAAAGRTASATPGPGPSRTASAGGAAEGTAAPTPAERNESQEVTP